MKSEMTLQDDDELMQYRMLLIACAVEWWSKYLRGGRTVPPLAQAGHTSRQAGEMDMRWMLSEAMSPARAEPDEVERFEQLLTRELAEIARENYCSDSGSWYGISLSTDYGPEGVLGQIVREANLSCCPFPTKTLMSIDDSGVRVAAGYHAPTEWLCATKSALVWDALEPWKHGYPLPSEFPDEQEREWRREAWEAGRKAMTKVFLLLPPFPEEPFDELVARLRSLVDQETSAAFVRLSEGA